MGRHPEVSRRKCGRRTLIDGDLLHLWLASLERLEKPAVLLGRRGECALIGASLDRPADDAALLLPGEPGAGKMVLLDAAADAASAAKAWVLRGARHRTGFWCPPGRKVLS